MKYVSTLLVAALAAATFALAAQSTEKVDAAAIAKIRDEGLNRSQVMDTLFALPAAEAEQS